jgi:hypothetical protein
MENEKRMATFTTFEDIEAWKRAHQVALEIYRAIVFPKARVQNFARRSYLQRI